MRLQGKEGKEGKEGKAASPEVRHLMMSCKSATLTKSILESCLLHGDVNVCVQINGTRSRLSSESSPSSSAGTTSSGLISSRCQRQTFFICVQTCRLPDTTHHQGRQHHGRDE